VDIKEEVRRRIADLTRFAYERGLRDGAQSALAEIENLATDDVVEQLSMASPPLETITDAKAASKKRTSKTAGKKRRPAKKAAKKPKSIIIQEVVLELLAANGEARRDEVLAAAQARDSRITKFDLGNGLRTLTKRSEIKVAPDDRSRLLPA
jgi:hypothetical protein